MLNFFLFTLIYSATRYEAEDAAVEGDCQVESSESGFSGTGT